MEKSKTNIRSFKELECWKACYEVKSLVASLTQKFPAVEKYDLVDNMRRASRSTTRNIAEGYGRFHFKENIQFCRITRGSLYEILDDAITALDEGYISVEESNELNQRIEKATKLLNGYIGYLQQAELNKVGEPIVEYETKPLLTNNQ